MSKSGLIVVLAAAFFAIAGIIKPTFAQTNASLCAPSVVSTTLCRKNEPTQCINLSPNSRVASPETPVFAFLTTNVQITTLTQGISETTITPTPTTTQEPAPPSTNLDSNKIFDLVNNYRVSQNLMPFEKNDDVCAVAQTRSGEIPAEIQNGTLHSGLYNRNLPYWIWENAKVGSNEEEAVAWWLSSPLHHQSIIGYYKYSCVKCQGTSCSQLFTSFSPK